MVELKFATLFSGGGGYDIGAIAAGASHVWGLEYRQDVAAVYEQNIGHCYNMDILTANPHDFPKVDLLHASPPCTNASTANTNAGETELDIALAHKVVEFIDVIRPRFFTLENVQGYDKFESFRIILQGLVNNGYAFNHWVLNSADYGVPQTRRRLIVIGRADGVIPQRPQPTHEKEPRGMFALPRWISWYEAIEDLIPGLPKSHLAKWQMERLPEVMKNSLLFNGANPNGNETRKYREIDEPGKTVTSDAMGAKIVLIDGKLSTSGDNKILNILEEQSPPATVLSSMSAMKDARIIGADIRQLTPQAIARIQSFPDSYIFPDKKTLAVYIIGNAIPPQLAKAIVRSLK